MLTYMLASSLDMEKETKKKSRYLFGNSEILKA